LHRPEPTAGAALDAALEQLRCTSGIVAIVEPVL
jgi:hypothetical protein